VQPLSAKPWQTVALARSSAARMRAAPSRPTLSLHPCQQSVPSHSVKQSASESQLSESISAAVTAWETSRAAARDCSSQVALLRSKAPASAPPGWPPPVPPSSLSIPGAPPSCGVIAPPQAAMPCSKRSKKEARTASVMSAKGSTCDPPAFPARNAVNRKCAGGADGARGGGTSVSARSTPSRRCPGARAETCAPPAADWRREQALSASPGYRRWSTSCTSSTRRVCTRSKWGP